MSLLRRIWQSLRNPAIYAGKDLEGNKFYEYPASSPDPRRTRRVVQYRHPNNMWDYIGGGKRLAIQWSSWLSHTRHEPPTIKELENDLARQIRVRKNAAMIEARDNEERTRMIEAGAMAVGEAQRQSRMEHTLQDERRPCTEETSSSEASSPSKIVGDENDMTVHKQKHQKPQHSENNTSLPWIEHTEDTLKPQEWTPRSHSQRD